MSDAINEAFMVSTGWRGAAKCYRTFVDTIGDVNCIVEIGVDRGYSLFTFARDYPNAIVIGFDSYQHYADANEAKQHVLKYLPHFPNARLEVLSSDAGSKLWRDPSIYMDIDVLHIDGDHMYPSVVSDFNNWHKAVRPGGVVLFHDINVFPNDVGKFFNALPGKKLTGDKDGPGIGAWFKDEE